MKIIYWVKEGFLKRIWNKILKKQNTVTSFIKIHAGLMGVNVIMKTMIKKYVIDI